MVGIFYYDLAAITMSVALFIAAMSKKVYYSKASKMYLVILGVVLITSVCDAASCFNAYLSIEALYIFTTFYHLFRNSLLVIYLIYVMLLCDLDNKIMKRKYLIIIGYIPITIVFGLILSNPFTHFVFYYDYIDAAGMVSEFPEYHRASGVAFIYANSVVYLGFTLYVIIRYRMLFNKREILCITSIFPLTLASLLIQFFNPGYLVEMFASALSAVLISIAIERPGDKIDNKFLIRNEKAFVDDLKKVFLFGFDKYSIVIKIKNSYEIYECMNYENVISYVRKLCSDIEKKYKLVDKNLKFYYIGNGLFIISLSGKEYLSPVCEGLKDDIKNLKNIGYKYVPDPQIILINIRKDFNDPNEYMFFINNYINRLSFEGTILKLSEIKEDKYFKIISNIDKIIENGLKNQEFEVYYQPIYNVKHNKYYSAEALVRLITKEYGVISPGLFIPYAEKSGLITKIDEYVFESVCKFISSDEFKRSELKYIEINLSMVDCISPTLYPNITFLMKKYNITPDKINIEITESYDSLNENLAKENIDKLKAYGFTFSLDDYGTGFSNIERFSVLPISYVKIDKSLVDSSEDNKMKIVLKNTFSLIKTMSRETIIEGIETKEQSDRFISFDCDNIQGYYYSKPLPLNDFIKFVNENNKINETE